MTHPDMRLVPVDTGPNFSDSSLPLDMIHAGADAIDRATDDMANYVSGETIDWDSGMMAVAVYRAMLAAAPHQPQPAAREEAPEVAGELTEGIVRTAHLTYTNYAEFPYTRSAMREAIQAALTALRAQQPAGGLMPGEDMLKNAYNDGYRGTKILKDGFLSTEGWEAVMAEWNRGSADANQRTARGLTKAQRYHVERGCISGDFTMATVNALKRKGLFELVISSPNGRCGFMELTPLGKQVQAALKAEVK